MGGGSEARISPIDVWREELETNAAARSQASEEQKAANAKTNRDAVLDATPVIGNARSAQSAMDSGGNLIHDLHYGHKAKARRNAGLFAADVLGAVTGLKFGKLSKAAAEGASSRAGVFVPVEEGTRHAEKARSMRDKGHTNEQVHRDTGLVFGADGSLREVIPDNKMDLDFSYKPGDITTVGAFVNHPSLFREMPELQNRIVRISDRVDTQPTMHGKPPRGIARTDPETGDFDYSLGGFDPYGDMAKLLQYDINSRVGFSPSGRHNFTDQMTDLNLAQSSAVMSGADDEAIAAYVQAIQKHKDDLLAGLSKKERFKDLSRKLTDRTAGSSESKFVRATVEQPNFARMYPYDTNPPWLKGGWKPPRFKDLLVLPPEKATRDDWQQFLSDWYRYGAGRGD